MDPDHPSQDDWEITLTGGLKTKISRAKSQAPEADHTTVWTALLQSTDQEASLLLTLLVFFKTP